VQLVASHAEQVLDEPERRHAVDHLEDHPLDQVERLTRPLNVRHDLVDAILGEDDLGVARDLADVERRHDRRARWRHLGVGRRRHDGSLVDAFRSPHA
jgi:hypothetical protein